jgi:hypothetical protein
MAGGSQKGGFHLGISRAGEFGETGRGASMKLGETIFLPTCFGGEVRKSIPRSINGLCLSVGREQRNNFRRMSRKTCAASQLIHKIYSGL